MLSEEYGYTDKETFMITREFPRMLERALSEALDHIRSKRTETRRGAEKVLKEQSSLDET
jgi:hypothetical protein